MQIDFSDILNWLDKQVGRMDAGERPANDFIISLHGQAVRNGSLSPKQTACVERMIREDAERAAKFVPQAQAQAAPKVDVAEGRYALARPEGVKFYKVEIGKHGKWEGFTFLNAQAGDEFWPIKAGGEKARILAEIAADPVAALVLYGKALGVCGVCGRTLTDRDSRWNGIGPVCAKNLNLPYEQAPVDFERDMDLAPESLFEPETIEHDETYAEIA